MEMLPDKKFDKLPAWAKDYICDLIREKQRLAERLDNVCASINGNKPSRIEIGNSHPGMLGFPLPEMPITFQLDSDPEFANPGQLFANSVRVCIREPRETYIGRRCLEIQGGRSLQIAPSASNTIFVLPGKE